MSTVLDVLRAPETRQHADRAAWIVFGVLLGTTLVGALAAITLGLPIVILFALPVVLVLAAVVRRPVFGLYTLFAAALLIPANPLHTADAIIDVIPFFTNLSDSGSLNVSGFGVTPAEIVMALAFIGLIGRDRTNQQSVPVGRLMTPYLAFGAVVVFGEVNGLLHGGNFKLSLWELRPQVYAFAMFAMANTLIRDKSQLRVLLTILVVCEVFKGAVGDFRYFVTLGGTLGQNDSVQPHEESYLLGLFVTVVLISLIWFRNRATVLLLALSPIVITAIITNHRRAGIGAVELEIVAVMILAYVLEPRWRKAVLIAGLVMVAAGIGFLAAFWNQQYGSIAELIRPIKSVIDPSARDASSDLYRAAEVGNLTATFRASPLFGIGFGHPYYILYPQAGIEKLDPLWNIIPHNTVLWIPMRMGILGMVAFWSLVSAVITEAIWAARLVRDRFVRSAVVLAVAAMLGELFYGYYDIGLENYRNMIVFGVLIAVINRASHMESSQRTPGSVAVRPTNVSARS